MNRRRAPLILIGPGTRWRGKEFSDYAIDLADAYTRAILAAGGLPWVIPCWPDEEFIAEAVRRSRGVVLTGGDDVEPALYRPSIPASLRARLGPVDVRRDLFELLLIREVFRQRKPLLAICRGLQILNVALGGTLLIDIATERPRAFNHARSDCKDEPVHEIRLARDSLLARIFGKRNLSVNSAHHQGVQKVARALRSTAVSSDGMVEALELRSGNGQGVPFLLAVHFHPERLFERYPEFGCVFGEFVRACAP